MILLADLPTRPRRFRVALLAALLAGASPGVGGASEAVEIPGQDHPGFAIYQKHCLECHGALGEGVTDVYDEPLYGNRSIDSLARRIERTMPEEEPELVVGEDARLVAEWAYAAFYSVEARARHAPPEVDFTRLTAEQHRRSLAKIVDRLRESPVVAPETGDGLRGRYYATSSFRRDEERPEDGTFERIDPLVSFDFGEASPKEEVIGEEEFSIRWEGVIVPEESGAHDFVLVTQNGARLFVNDLETALIDGRVTSGSQVREERGSIELVAGRPYALRLDFFSYLEKSASIELRWRPPHGAEEVLPAQVLAPAPTRVPETFAESIPFIADDSSDGYPRGKTISPEWLRSSVEAAAAFSEFIADRADQLAPSGGDESPSRAEAWSGLAAEIAEIAFRRPLDAEAREEYVGSFFDGSEDPGEALKRSLVRILTAPRFLYPEAGHAEPDSHTVAARLALFLWDSLPDAELAAAADEGLLADREQVAAQALRLARDSRARAKLHRFFEHWLELEHADGLHKDAELFPQFDDGVVADLRRSLRHFVEEVVWGDEPDYRRLLLSDELWLNRRLAAIYAPHLLEKTDGDPLPEGRFVPVKFDPERHSGLVSHPLLLAAHAYHNDTSPIHRGVFLAENLAGRPLREPPNAIFLDDASFDPHLTMREKVTEMTKDATCMSCHVLINPLGFSLESYDAIGRWRETDEQGRPVDPVSDYTTDEGETIRLAGPRDVAAYAAESDLAHRAFVRQLFHHLVKQPVEAYGLQRMDQLHADFESRDCDILALVVEIALCAAGEGVFALSGDALAQGR